ncbi:BolA family protein [Paludibacterium yongneupense]|uniref:BolA family protein n=1 Tax=Paludibacterium yongneupense TaxID=400061 RepID=UPI0004194813|nr:BolA family protein [Paludibacterium yongneupense]
MSDIRDEILSRLTTLDATHIELIDDSAAHAGHAGARAGGGHYRLALVSPRFTGLNRVARHRLVHQALADLMPNRIHALVINVKSPEEI